MVFAPGGDIPVQVDRLAVRKRLSVQVGQVGAGEGAYHVAIGVPEGEAGDSRQVRRTRTRSSGQQLRERDFAFADDDGVRSGSEVPVHVIGRVRPSQDHERAACLAARDEVQHVHPGHEVRVDAHDRWPQLVQASLECIAVRERGVEHLHAQPLRLEV